MKDKPKRTAATPEAAPPALPFPRGLTIKQAAELLHYSQATIRRMIYSGELVAIQPRGARGRTWLIDEHSLHNMLKENWQFARHNTANVQANLKKGYSPF